MSSSEVLNPEANGTTSSTISQLISEIEQSLQTRSDLFTTEVKQKLPVVRSALQLGLAGALLLVASYLFFVIAAVVLIGSAFPANPYRWFFGFATVGILSVGFGAIGIFLTKSGLIVRSIFPMHTLSVLKSDKDWVMSEIQQRK